MASKHRPECKDSNAEAIADDTALYLILKSISKRRALIHGRLHDGRGHHCAIGCFWQDNPKITLTSRLIDEVAAVNDSLPPTATPQQRWKLVNGWLRWKVRVLANMQTNAQPKAPS